MTDVVRTDLGRVAVDSKALRRLVVRAAEQVDGARVRRPRRGVQVELEGGTASVTLELAVRRGLVLLDLGRRVQERVAEALGSMLEVRVERVDVTIEEITS